MTAGLRTLVMVLTVAVLAVFSGAPAHAAGTDVLSPMDVRAYRAAFAAVERGDFDEADETLDRIKDKSLAGHLLFLRLMHPTAHRATYDELSLWLKAYGDLPGADRIYALAMKRKPDGAADPTEPAFMTLSRGWTRIEAAAAIASGPASPDKDRAAREAYYSGDAERALALAPAGGNPWIAGLAAWRLGKYDQAQAYFRAVALDADEDEWLRAAGAFWAARSSKMLGDSEQSVAFLRMAARTPWCFYGMIAERALELDGLRVSEAEPVPAFGQPMLIRVSTAATPALPDLTGLIRTNKRAHRAAALMQVGREAEAGLELRAGLTAAKGAEERRRWEALTLALNAPLTSAVDTPAPRALPGRGGARAGPTPPTTRRPICGPKAAGRSIAPSSTPWSGRKAASTPTPSPAPERWG